jgi:DNA polymerase
VETRHDEHPALRLLEAGADLGTLADGAEGCRACPLYARATQAVFGEGPPHATMMLVGEQPGDQEDLEGAPFVGPAGRVLDQALAAAGVPRDDVYVTNAVKHFKWKDGGWRRLHVSPNAREIAACRPWLEAEVATVQPAVIVGMGATACKAMLGPAVRVTRDRGQRHDWNGRPVLVTVHPSSLLRRVASQTPDERNAELARFAADLAAAAELARSR